MSRLKLSVKLFILFLAATLALSGCGVTKDSSDSITVYATTGYLADAVKNIAPDASVTTMVGPGGDPHTYQPSTKDIELIQSADLVFSNGLHLEAQMLDLLDGLGDKHLAVGEKITPSLLLDWPEEDEHGNPLKDPHIWNSPAAWREVVRQVAEKFAAADPENAETYLANATNYVAEIDEAVQNAHELLSAEKIDNRILVTGHDAFNYFGQTFDLKVYATDFISSEAQLSAKELSELADLIAQEEVPVIFVDNQVNPQAIKSLQEAVHARGFEVEISDHELYADSLGASEPQDTYIGALTHNAEAISEAFAR